MKIGRIRSKFGVQKMDYLGERLLYGLGVFFFSLFDFGEKLGLKQGVLTPAEVQGLRGGFGGLESAGDAKRFLDRISIANQLEELGELGLIHAVLQEFRKAVRPCIE